MKTLAASSLCLWVAACASYDGHSLRAGASTESEVRSVMGMPANEFANADGSKRLAYPHGPLGTQTYMADVGTDGILKAVTPVLRDETFYRIQPGLTRDDILRMIGPPGETMAFPRLGQVAWDYRYQDTWGYQAIFSVMFDANGIVVGKFTRRIETDRNKR
jgi:hypothetical protein